MEHDQVLGKDSLASLNEVFLIIRAKERRSVMLNIITSKGSGLSILSSQNSQIHSTNFGRGKLFRQPSNKDSLWGNHCKKPRHTKEMCWKLHGKPKSLSRNGGNWNQQQLGQ